MSIVMALLLVFLPHSAIPFFKMGMMSKATCSNASSTIDISPTYKLDLEAASAESFNINMSQPACGNVSVGYSVRGSSQHGIHHDLQKGTVVFSKGDQFKSVNYNLLNNGSTDNVKFIHVSIGEINVSGITASKSSTMRHWIEDDETSIPQSITDVSVGHSGHACVVLADGKLKCWGYNISGQIGNGTTTNQPTPIIIDSGTNYSKVAGGSIIPVVLPPQEF